MLCTSWLLLLMRRRALRLPKLDPPTRESGQAPPGSGNCFLSLAGSPPQEPSTCAGDREQDCLGQRNISPNLCLCEHWKSEEAQ